jgi:hypothetical protein
MRIGQDDNADRSGKIALERCGWFLFRPNDEAAAVPLLRLRSASVVWRAHSAAFDG